MRDIIVSALSALVTIIEYAVIIRCLLSWFPVNRNNPLIKFIYSFTEPVLAPVRAMISKSPLGGSGMVIDFSPIFAFLLLRLILNYVVRIIYLF